MSNQTRRARIKPETFKRKFFGNRITTNKWIVSVDNGSEIIVDTVLESEYIKITTINKNGKGYLEVLFTGFDLITIDNKTGIKFY